MLGVACACLLTSTVVRHTYVAAHDACTAAALKCCGVQLHAQDRNIYILALLACAERVGGLRSHLRYINACWKQRAQQQARKCTPQVCRRSLRHMAASLSDNNGCALWFAVSCLVICLYYSYWFAKAFCAFGAGGSYHCGLRFINMLPPQAIASQFTPFGCYTT